MPLFTTYYAALSDGTLDDAAKIKVTDAGGNYTGTDVETALVEIADGTTLDAKYAPKSGDRTYVPALAFTLVTGSPAESNLSSVVGWRLDSASSEVVGDTRIFPDHWSTYDVYAWWSNTSASAGDVVLEFSHQTFSDGDSLGGSTIATQTVAAAGSSTAKRTSMVSGVAAVSGDAVKLKMGRLGADGSDTLANDILLIGVEYVRAS